MTGTLPKAPCIGEANRPKCAHDFHVASLWPPAELLSGVFLYIVKSGLSRGLRLGDVQFFPSLQTLEQSCNRVPSALGLVVRGFRQNMAIIYCSLEKRTPLPDVATSTTRIHA